MRACREHGLETVAVYADCDRCAPHVRYADQAVSLCANEPAESYLAVNKIIEAAKKIGADAVHPGYGFLAENSSFARAVHEAGLIFIGPRADVIELMGGKIAAREVAARAGVPIIPGTDGTLPNESSEVDLKIAGEGVGYPLFVKATAGGGGKGMRLVRKPDELVRSIHAARSEAASAFGSSEVYLERCIEHGRHIEVQLLADEHGTVVPFVERECSVQRRHQKVIEETPSPIISDETRRKLASAAARLASEVGYTNAGTIECLYDESSGEFYFLEMNTRLQVEHPITEMVTGIDIVRWQLRVALGERLDIDPERALTPDGHAIECRVYAEDPAAGFMPSPGLLISHRLPEGPGIRVDSGVAAGFNIPVFYDSMISKVIAHAADRRQDLDRMSRALAEYDVRGVPTTIPLFRWLLTEADFVSGRFDTTYLDRALIARDDVPFLQSCVGDDAEDLAVLAAAVSVAMRNAEFTQVPATNCGGSEFWRRAGRIEGLR